MGEAPNHLINEWLSFDVPSLPTCRCPPIGFLALVHFGNVRRLILLPRLVMSAFEKGRNFGQWSAAAFQEVFKDDPVSKGFADERWESYVSLFEKFESGERSLPNMLGEIAKDSRLALTETRLAFGEQIESLMQNQLVGIWTAFETLAGDLWETALNVYPQAVYDLKLKRPNSSSTRSVPIPNYFLQRHGFNLENQMGSALRSQFKFSTLRGIRRAYQALFDRKATAIHESLDATCLDALSAVRNLIAHRNGECDFEYERKAKKFPEAPMLSPGKMLHVDGAIVKNLFKPVVDCSFKTILAVDAWLAGKSQDRRE